ncbi:putative quinol monooxygenase [Paraburkholderia bryophila]|nr:putative quinol monooxygenase [Paraburkholderia bryophila]
MFFKNDSNTEGKLMADEVMLMILIQTKPGRGAEQLAAYRQLAPIVRAEEGCRQYDLHPVAGDEDRFVLLEKWSSKEALAAHDITAHMIAADAHSPTFRAGPATVLQLGATSVA